MEVGILISWGSVIPGREKEAVELYAETMKVYGEKLADGTFTYFEPFLFRTGDRSKDVGFFILKGPQEKVMAYFDSRANRILRDRIGQFVNHLKIDFLYAGTDVVDEIAIFTDATTKVPALV